MRVTLSTNRFRAGASAATSKVRVLFGPDAGTEVDVPAAGLTVGADETADLPLKDPAVSRRHCSIVPIAGGFDVSDLGSRNGTLLDGARIQRATVPAGGILRLGGSLLQLVPAEELLDIPPSAHERFGEMVGKSLVMRRVFALVERAAQSDAPILFLGESGTGKELAARAVHATSRRSHEPFVVFDCGASSETLIESDLFGHKKGAFTGAHEDRPGAFELADRGTLFLDEIGDLPLSLQPKLLRLLERGEVTPLGGRTTKRFDVRIVAATHRDLAQEVARGTFRGDLYYRLAVVEIHLPPLRARLEDLEPLVEALLARAGRPDAKVAGPNLDKLRGYHFPGNVRELRNIVTRAVALSLPGASFSEMPILLGGVAAPAAEAARVRADRPFQEAKADVLARFERDYLTDLLREAGGNLSQAARISGIERKHLYRVLRRAGLAQGGGEAADDE